MAETPRSQNMSVVSLAPKVEPAALSLLSLAVAAALLPAGAMAQNAPVQLPTVKVEGQPAQPAPSEGYKAEKASSPKQTAPLLDTPQTITVIPQALIKEQGARNLTEVLKNTPGISFNAGENGFATSSNNFSMRGFDTSGNIFIDGSRDSGSYARDVFNIEQVEVVKGAAADNGRGGASGYVNMVTKTPGLQNFYAGDASLGFDEYDSELRKRAAVDLNQVLAGNTALRLNMMLEDSGVGGREIAEAKAFGFAPSVAFGLGTDLRAKLAYEHVERNDLPDWGVPGATISDTLAYSPATAGYSRDSFYGLRSDYDDVTSDVLLARLEYDITSRFSISNQTRFARVERDARYTIPTGFTAATGVVATQTQFYARVNTSISNQTNLSVNFDTGAVQHTLATGLELTREQSDADRFGTTNSNTTLFNPNPDRAVAFNGAPTENNKINVDTAALYVYDTARIGPQWEVTGGLRAERYTVDIESRTAAGAPAGTFDGFEDSQNTLGGKVGLVYKPAESGSIYSSFGLSALPPGSYLSNSDISRTGDNAFPGFVQGAKPVKSYNYEIGTKWNFFSDRLSTAVALFRTEKTDVPITGRDVGDTADSLKGYGKQVVQGIEFSASGEITEGWNLFGGVALMESERKHSAYLDEVRRRANAGDYGAYTSTNGDELAFTPRVTGNLWTTYRLPFGVTIGGGMQYVGSSYLGRPDDALRIIPNGMFGKLPAYMLFNAMASYEVLEGVQVRFNIDNIADKQYASSTNWNGSRASLGLPRTFMLSTNFKF